MKFEMRRIRATSESMKNRKLLVLPVLALLLFVGVAQAQSGLFNFFSVKEPRTAEDVYSDAADAFNAHISESVKLYKSLVAAERDLAIKKGKQNFGVNTAEDIRLAEKIEQLEKEIYLVEQNKITPRLVFDRPEDEPQSGKVKGS